VQVLDAPTVAPALTERLQAAFLDGAGPGLLQLGAGEVDQALPAAWRWWRDLAARYVTALCTRAGGEGGHQPLAPPDEQVLSAMVDRAPPMEGAEYLSVEVLTGLWQELDGTVAARLADGSSLQALLASLNPAWHVVGRVHFNLAENRRDPASPFAFMATWTHGLSAHGAPQHLPLGKALQAYADAASRDRLLALLQPVQRAAAELPWLAAIVDSGEVFHPLRWSAAEAARLLADTPALERAGVVVRMPAAWGGGRPARPRVTATVGGKVPSALGTAALLDFEVSLTLGEERLSAEEVRAILQESSGLALVRGQWVEVDADRLRRALDRFERIEALAREHGLPFAEAMRLVAGAELGPGTAQAADPDWSAVVGGPWLAQVLRDLRSPQRAALQETTPGLQGTLRPYQAVGLRWLSLVTGLGLGACLADDMGLGKTVQVLALLLSRQADGAGGPCLLVAPASLLANWAAEARRFAPTLRVLVAHPSAMPAAQVRALDATRLGAQDLVITTYGSLLRQPWATAIAWDLVVLDEAQAIKNPGARQTRAAKGLRARARIALTGTPVENRLSDLWSIFDFLNPGLLGSGRAFTAYVKRLSDARSSQGYGPLRELVRPYILRRLKSDRSIIADLPDKTELRAFCSLSRRQVALYAETVSDLASRLEGAEGIGRRGLVLATLMRMKQICNHPSQWLGDGAWAEADSGKWARLREICEVVASRQEKILVFTQFREIIEPLQGFLGGIFGRPGLALHGATSVRKRQELVTRFQQDETVPFFVLSLKAGGAGLNLTAASHVVHFDRWWNPAVEEQATDRAYRIGQHRNVLVHKFVCRGTVEDTIDQLIESKRALSRELLEGGQELDLAALSDADLLKLVALDLNAATGE